jgi:hypothetical protein
MTASETTDTGPLRSCPICGSTSLLIETSARGVRPWCASGCALRRLDDFLASLGIDREQLDAEWLRAHEESTAAARARDSKRSSANARAVGSTTRLSTVSDSAPAEEGVGAVLIDLSEVEPRPVEWLWAGRIPCGKITILDGDPDVGKSSLALDLASRVSTGAAMPDGTPGIRGTVVLLSAEDDPGDTIVPRLLAAGADLTRVRLVEGVKGERGETRLIALPTDLGALESALRETQAVLVVVDPLMAFLDSEVNAHRDQDVRRALAPLARLAERSTAAFLVVRHLNKSSGAHALYRGGGSIGIIGAARSGLLAARDPEDDERRVLAVTKSNLARRAPSLAYSLVGESETVRVEWLGECTHSASSLLAVPLDDEERSAIQAAVDFLETELRAGPISQKDLRSRARGAGFADATLRRAKERLGVVARKTGMREGWVWQLPSTGLAPKVLNGPEDAQPLTLSAFGESEHLREAKTPSRRGIVDTEEHLL